MRELVRWAAIACLVAVVVLSLLPGADRPHTGASGNVEHAIAYAGAAFFASRGLPWLRGWRTVVLLSAASALFEICQIFIPGRGPGVDNWLASSLGAVAGVLAASLAVAFLRRRAARAPII